MKTLKRDTSNKGMIGYASAYEQICRKLDKQNAKPIHANIKSIIAMSEGLSNHTKQSMEKYFKAPIVSSYSNMENGIIALQCPNKGSDFQINWASYFVEVLKFICNDSVETGTLDRIIITALFNYSMPLISYNTGDVGSLDYTVNPPVFNKIERRKMDMILNIEGNIVSSFIILHTFNFKGVLQSQLIQEAKKKYLIKLNVCNEFKQEFEFIEEFKTYLSKDAQIKIQYVNEIPLLNSGKRKATVNNYFKKNNMIFIIDKNHIST